MPDPLLTVSHLSIAFPSKASAPFNKLLLAVRDVSFEIYSNELLALVGESGSGKSLSSLSLLNLIPAPGRIATGTICFDGQNLLTLNEPAMRRIRGRQIAYIPQDPMTSLNPVLTIGSQLMEILRHHLHLDDAAARARAIELLDLVRIPHAAERLSEYPHQFSGGMRQRVLIAMALACQPKLLIADEPTTALDVTVQAQILDVFRDLRAQMNLTVLLITHDLGVVAEMADRVAVMYAGRIVEVADVAALFHKPAHPYTQALLSSIPRLANQWLKPIDGVPPSLNEIPEQGCAFFPRCLLRLPQCETDSPEEFVLQTGTEGARHTTECHWAQQQDITWLKTGSG
ncbi:MAG: ABC transporter ATP-binding protein [Vampirovibrionales bacterium]|nr:ABC transporter ATP-binding protein [Vampirovibrionales bacterium]